MGRHKQNSGKGKRLGEELVCNCAECNCELVTQKYRTEGGGVYTETQVAGRIKGRPYCKACLNPGRSEAFQAEQAGNPAWNSQIK